ncbi:hypothetical protein V8E51_014131 [Hyaloscypha variabilis]
MHSSSVSPIPSIQPSLLRPCVSAHSTRTLCSALYTAEMHVPSRSPCARTPCPLASPASQIIATRTRPSFLALVTLHAAARCSRAMSCSSSSRGI